MLLIFFVILRGFYPINSVAVSGYLCALANALELTLGVVVPIF